MHNPPGFVQGLCRIERVVQEFGVVQEFAFHLARRQGAADLIASRIPPGRIVCVVGGWVVFFVLCVFPVFPVFVGLVVVLLCCCAAVLLGCCFAVLLACCLANWLEKQNKNMGREEKQRQQQNNPVLEQKR